MKIDHQPKKRFVSCSTEVLSGAGVCMADSAWLYLSKIKLRFANRQGNARNQLRLFAARCPGTNPANDAARCVPALPRYLKALQPK
eukprot:1644412-Rhodomonas_salina.1